VQIGDELWSRTCERVTVTAIGHKQGQFTVYNFEVEDFHSYFVGADEVLGHNECETTKWQYITAWHDKRATAIFGAGKGRYAVGGRNYDKQYKGRDIEFKSDNFSKGPRNLKELDRMNVQIDKDIANKISGRANPHWHFDHDPSVAPEMTDILNRLKGANIKWTWGATTPF
jgi:hypothetical protein